MPELTATLEPPITGWLISDYDDIIEDECDDPLCCPRPSADIENNRPWREYSPIQEEASLPEQTTAPTNLDIRHLTPIDTGYGQHLRATFQFFRRNANNRYSSQTLMRLANAAGEYDDRTRQGTVESPRTSSLLPVLTVAGRPLSYDEDTEVKTGGTVGMMVTWPDGKSLMAVAAGSRRQGIGRRIFSHNQSWSTVAPFFWVNVGNVPAQQFLLSMGLQVTGLNGYGAVRYGFGGSDE